MKDKTLRISLLLVVAFLCGAVVSCSDDEPPTSTTQTEPGPVEEAEPTEEPETEEPEPTIVPDGTINGYEYVDMGLSVLWATRAVGASSLEELSVTRATGDIDYGDYFAWGDVEPKEEYTFGNCLTVAFSSSWKDITADPRYDAATVNWGSPWRMPTSDEMQELIDNCEWKWTTLNGVDGMLVTSEINGNSIFFLPAAGYYYGSWLYYAGDEYPSHRGYYWTSSPSSENNMSYSLHFSSEELALDSLTSRYYGIPVWPVAGPAPFDLQNIDESGNVNGHDCIDIGLSVLWATCNIGASSPEEYGDYFAWGEIEPKQEYTEENCATWGIELEDISGDPRYDAATANWGAPWRMPTYEELLEFRYATFDIEQSERKGTEEQTTLNGVNGILFSSAVNRRRYGDSDDDFHGNQIFLPATGYYSESSLYDAGDEGDYWTSTPSSGQINGNYVKYANGFTFYINQNPTAEMGNYYNRSRGQCVRPVCDR